MLTTMVLNKDGFLERNDHYDPEEMGFPDYVCRELHQLLNDGATILDICGRVYVLIDNKSQPLFLHDYQEDFGPSLIFPST